MIRHIVLVKFQPDVTDAQISAIFSELHDIKAKLPGVLSITAGRSESPEQIERGYMHGFTIDFDSRDDLAAYAEDAEHKRWGAEIVAHAEGGLAGVLVLDIDA